MIRCVIFDYDGTIADTAEIVEKSFRETVKHFTGHVITRKEFIDVFGMPLTDMMAFYDKDRTEEMVKYYREYFSIYQDLLVKPFPGVVDTIKRLKQLKIKTAIVSSRTRRGIEHGINLFGLADSIDLVIGVEDTQNSKPHPDPVLKAIDMFGIEGKQAIMVGDSPHDIIAAKKAGIKACAVQWSLFGIEKLNDLNPDFKIEAMVDLLDIIKE
ncbi:HAD-IA family hydrolase [Calorimonas adulescens]|nr:HAD-IA family hydrolase [Calorimonas adulescens]